MRGENFIVRTVAVVSEDNDFRRQIAEFLRASHYEVHSFALGESFQAVGACSAFDCTILGTDLSRPGPLDLLVDARASGSARPVVVIGAADELRIAISAIKLGASEFLAIPVSSRQLLEAVQEAIEVRPSCAPPIDPDAKARIEALPPRQQQVLLGIAQGKMNKIIAFELGLSVRTVETYRASLMEKIGGTVADAIRLAASGGLLPACAACVATRAMDLGRERRSAG